MSIQHLKQYQLNSKLNLLNLNLQEIKRHLRTIDPTKPNPLISDKGSMLATAIEHYHKSEKLQDDLNELVSNSERLQRSHSSRVDPQIISMAGLARRLQKDLSDVQREMIRVLGFSVRDLRQDMTRYSTEPEDLLGKIENLAKLGKDWLDKRLGRT